MNGTTLAATPSSTDRLTGTASAFSSCSKTRRRHRDTLGKKSARALANSDSLMARPSLTECNAAGASGQCCSSVRRARMYRDSNGVVSSPYALSQNRLNVFTWRGEVSKAWGASGTKAAVRASVSVGASAAVDENRSSQCDATNDGMPKLTGAYSLKM